MITCDIGTLSTALGRAYSGNDPNMTLTGSVEWLAPAYEKGTVAEKAACVVTALRYLQYASRDQAFYKARASEIQRRADAYLAEALGPIQAAAQLFAGRLEYQARDMYELLDQAAEDPDGVILCNPPRYSGGYDKMFPGDQLIEWNRPEVKQFREADYAALMESLTARPNPTLVYYATTAGEDENPAKTFPGWTSVFASRPQTGGPAAVNWILAPSQWAEKWPIRWAREGNAPKHANWPLFDGVINENTRLELKRLGKSTALYYRSLLAHRFGNYPQSRVNMGLFANGQLLAVMGAMTDNLLLRNRKDGRRMVELTYCMSVPWANPRVQKLALMTVCTSSFWRVVIDPLEQEPVEVGSTVWSPYPEVKTPRGIMKREGAAFDEKARLYRVRYVAPIADRTLEQTRDEWLRRFAK